MNETNFKAELESAADDAGEKCRGIANKTWGSLSQKGRKKYGAENEAVFKALLYATMSNRCAPGTLTLEPGRAYNHADLAYSPDGLRWDGNKSESVFLVEVKTVAKDPKGDLLNRKNILGKRAMKYDIDKLNQWGSKTARLFEVAAFIDYDADNYYDRNQKSVWERKIKAQLSSSGVQMGGVKLIVS